MSDEHIKKWWNEVSEGYQADFNLGTESAHYGPYAPDENTLRLLGDVTGKRILEIGCGGGQCSIAFAKQGAICTGIDLSAEQIAFARNLASENSVEVTFKEGDVQTLTGEPDDYYDVVFTAFALQYIADLTQCFKEVRRVLKPGGIFVFSLDHPFYHVHDPESGKPVNSYHDTGRKEIDEVWPDGLTHKFVVYARKLSDFVNSIIAADLKLLLMLEPYEPDAPYWRDLYKQELVAKTGATVIFKTQKI